MSMADALGLKLGHDIHVGGKHLEAGESHGTASTGESSHSDDNEGNLGTKEGVEGRVRLTSRTYQALALLLRPLASRLDKGPAWVADRDKSDPFGEKTTEESAAAAPSGEALCREEEDEEVKVTEIGGHTEVERAHLKLDENNCSISGEIAIERDSLASADDAKAGGFAAGISTLDSSTTDTADYELDPMYCPAEEEPELASSDNEDVPKPQIALGQDAEITGDVYWGEPGVVGVMESHSRTGKISFMTFYASKEPKWEQMPVSGGLGATRVMDESSRRRSSAAEEEKILGFATREPLSDEVPSLLTDEHAKDEPDEVDLGFGRAVDLRFLLSEIERNGVEWTYQRYRYPPSFGRSYGALNDWGRAPVSGARGRERNKHSERRWRRSKRGDYSAHSDRFHSDVPPDAVDQNPWYPPSRPVGREQDQESHARDRYQQRESTAVSPRVQTPPSRAPTDTQKRAAYLMERLKSTHEAIFPYSIAAAAAEGTLLESLRTRRSDGHSALSRGSGHLSQSNTPVLNRPPPPPPESPFCAPSTSHTPARCPSRFVEPSTASALRSSHSRPFSPSEVAYSLVGNSRALGCYATTDPNNPDGCSPATMASGPCVADVSGDHNVHFGTGPGVVSDGSRTGHPSASGASVRDGTTERNSSRLPSSQSRFYSTSDPGQTSAFSLSVGQAHPLYSVPTNRTDEIETRHGFEFSKGVGFPVEPTRSHSPKVMISSETPWAKARKQKLQLEQARKTSVAEPSSKSFSLEQRRKALSHTRKHSEGHHRKHRRKSRSASPSSQYRETDDRELHTERGERFDSQRKKKDKEEEGGREKRREETSSSSHNFSLVNNTDGNGSRAWTPPSQHRDSKTRRRRNEHAPSSEGTHGDRFVNVPKSGGVCRHKRGRRKRSFRMSDESDQEGGSTKSYSLTSKRLLVTVERSSSPDSSDKFERRNERRETQESHLSSLRRVQVSQTRSPRSRYSHKQSPENKRSRTRRLKKAKMDRRDKEKEREHCTKGERKYARDDLDSSFEEAPCSKKIDLRGIKEGSHRDRRTGREVYRNSSRSSRKEYHSKKTRKSLSRRSEKSFRSDSLASKRLRRDR